MTYLLNLGKIVFVFAVSVISLQLTAQEKTLVVDIDRVQSAVQPTMWGVFFEDINMGADGGLYAEMIKNRSFEFSKPLMGWSVRQQSEGDILVLNRKAANNTNPRYLSVGIRNPKSGEVKLTNEGFHGMGIKEGLQYHFSVMYRQQTSSLKLHVELLSAGGKIIGETILYPQQADNNWHTQTAGFIAKATEQKGKLNIWFEGNGKIDLDMISLFPEDTWKGRPNGLRADMVQMLAEMKPGFVRFPGGCIVEGFDLANRYQWKKTIGPIAERELIINRWNNEFAHRPSPDYFQSFGLGFFEYFQLCEDIGAAPLPILNCGMACQFNTAEVVPLNELGPYVQDALDLVEFANGDASTKWGKIRSDMGHPSTFNMKMIGIGNENWGPQYLERLAVFTKAIKAKYPEVKIVNSCGTDSDGERFDLLNNTLRNNKADIIDEHYYRNPGWFLENATRYDNYPRNATKVFAGEYAAQSDRIASPENHNNLFTALSEAAFMTGLERNADVVTMASYAPLFAHTDGWQWTPDLIWVDNLKVIGTPNYYVQKLFSLNKGTKVVSITCDNNVIAGKDSLYASSVVDENTNELIIKLVNVSGKKQTQKIVISGSKKKDYKGEMFVLDGDPNAVNRIGMAQKTEPKTSSFSVKQNSCSFEVSPFSFSVLRLKLNEESAGRKNNKIKK